LINLFFLHLNQEHQHHVPLFQVLQHEIQVRLLNEQFVMELYILDYILFQLYVIKVQQVQNEFLLLINNFKIDLEFFYYLQLLKDFVELNQHNLHMSFQLWLQNKFLYHHLIEPSMNESKHLVQIKKYLSADVIIKQILIFIFIRCDVRSLSVKSIYAILLRL
jgi:hypothetical protein